MTGWTNIRLFLMRTRTGGCTRRPGRSSRKKAISAMRYQTMRKRDMRAGITASTGSAGPVILSIMPALVWGASSMVDNVRWKNTDDMESYLSVFAEDADIGQDVKEDVQTLSRVDHMEEFMFWSSAARTVHS